MGVKSKKGRLSSRREPEGGGGEEVGIRRAAVEVVLGRVRECGGRRHEARSSRNLIARNSVTGCCPPDNVDRFGIRGFTIDRGGAATHRAATSAVLFNISIKRVRVVCFVPNSPGLPLRWSAGAFYRIGSQTHCNR